MEEAQLLLDDHTIKSQAMQSSPAAEAFEERIEAWVKKLTAMQDIFDSWLLAQVGFVRACVSNHTMLGLLCNSSYLIVSAVSRQLASDSFDSIVHSFAVFVL